RRLPANGRCAGRPTRNDDARRSWIPDSKAGFGTTKSRYPPSSDLLDNRAVVEIALAVAHASREHVGMDREKWQPLPRAPGLRQHQVHVLEMLGDAAFRGELAAHHLRTLHVHHLRIGGGAAPHVEEARG